jgi:hypothetical protein
MASWVRGARAETDQYRSRRWRSTRRLLVLGACGGFAVAAIAGLFGHAGHTGPFGQSRAAHAAAPVATAPNAEALNFRGDGAIAPSSTLSAALDGLKYKINTRYGTTTRRSVLTNPPH